MVFRFFCRLLVVRNHKLKTKITISDDKDFSHPGSWPYRWVNWASCNPRDLRGVTLGRSISPAFPLDTNEDKDNGNYIINRRYTHMHRSAI